MPANFDVRLEQMASTSWGLHIRNNGAGEISEMRVELDGTVVHEHPAYVENQLEQGVVEGLSGGDEVGYLLMTREASVQPPYQLRIVHTDEDGITHEYSSTIGG